MKRMKREFQARRSLQGRKSVKLQEIEKQQQDDEAKVMRTA
jgi:hypothetical protein